MLFTLCECERAEAQVIIFYFATHTPIISRKMNPLLFISSLPFLDLLDNLIVLAAEFVAIFCLDEEAHSRASS